MIDSLCRHELGGRAFGTGAVELYVHNLQDMQFEESFTLTGCSGSNCTYADGGMLRCVSLVP